MELAGALVDADGRLDDSVSDNRFAAAGVAGSLAAADRICGWGVGAFVDACSGAVAFVSASLAAVAVAHHAGELPRHAHGLHRSAARRAAGA